MNKVYCDVCGTAYSEKDTHCHNCGCARPANENLNKDSYSESESYSYVKGGRFSKANVRKRNQEKLYNEVSPQMDTQHEIPHDNEDKTDKGLAIAVCILLLAIVAVVIYIVTRFYIQAPVNNESNHEQNQQLPVESSTSASLVPETTVEIEIPTTEETAEPTVDQTVSPTETEPTVNSNYYIAPYTLSTEKRKNDVTIYRRGTFELKMYDATGELMDVEWIVADTNICSVEGNVVTGLKVGKTTVYVIIDGITYSCVVRVKG